MVTIENTDPSAANSSPDETPDSPAGLSQTFGELHECADARVASSSSSVMSSNTLAIHLAMTERALLSRRHGAGSTAFMCIDMWTAYRPGMPAAVCSHEIASTGKETTR